MADERYIMSQSRSAMTQGLDHIERQLDAIEANLDSEPLLVFDFSKAVVEATCKRILAERSVAFENTDDLPRLFNLVLERMPLLPAAASGESAVRASLAKTLGGLRTTVQGLCELRNECGIASHGSSGPKPVLDRSHALVAAQAADLLVGFLYQLHCERSDRPAPPARYVDFEAFNDWLDEQVELVQILASVYPASEVLFAVDPEAYSSYQVEFADSAASDAGVEDE